ncbi:hypothetical protein WME99_06325 [Sorangium sp. So ce136]|uniref:hypothetical protein n=1 Tax=Sorangium sp. So ce136 TaxID=3133284 RepID=UPI003F119D33
MVSSTCAAGLVVLLALAPGCGGGDEPPAQGVVELGTGEWRFEPLADGQEVELAHGAQGGWHMWTSVRTFGLEPEGVELEVTTTVVGDPSSATTSRGRIELTELEDGRCEFIGWPAVLREPACAIGHTLQIRGVVLDARGTVATGERQVRPWWNSDETCAGRP